MEGIKVALESTPLHQLQGKLEEYGVGEAFKHGKKKNQIIDEAIQILERRAALPVKEEIEEDLEDSEDEGSEETENQDLEPGSSGEGSESDTKTSTEGSVVGEQEIVKDETAGISGTQNANVPKSDQDAKVKPNAEPGEQETVFKLSRKDIEKNIQNCKLNLIGAGEEKKKFLLDKITELEGML